MLRRIIIIVAALTVPIVIYVAAQYGRLTETTFAGAITATAAGGEGDQAPKVIIVTTIDNPDAGDGYMTGHDGSGRAFRIQYTGSAPEQPFTKGTTVRFVGHVHGADDGYFHATQVYGK